ncbi:hypothetical protein GCM10020254_46000 [Streptomyces goshikiensis]
MGGVAADGPGAVARVGGGAVRGVLVDGFEHAVAHAGGGRVGEYEGFVDEGAEGVGDVQGIGRVGGVPVAGVIGTDGLGRGEVAAAGEDGQAAQDGAFGRVQEVPGPVDDGAQGLLAGQDGPRAAGQEPEAVVEAVGDLARGQQPQPGRGQLDGEREAVQAGADLGDGVRVVGGGEAGAGGGAAVGEEAVRGGRAAAARRGGRFRRGRRGVRGWWRGSGCRGSG